MSTVRGRVLTGQLILLLFFVGAILLIRQSVDISQDPLVIGEAGPEEALLLVPEGREPYQAGNPYDETVALLNLGDYWATRYTYPTFHFDPSWVREAAAQDKFIPKGMPAGEYSHNLETPLTLDPNSFTFVGPYPLLQSGRHVAGRINVIAVDPTNTAVVYIGSDGGGVWKTTNCCTANTTWFTVTDALHINSIAIGDLIIDPNNSNIIYAGTGDLRYGSYSFGSAGLLKSTDAGSTWAVLGEDVFGPVYPTTGFPQYQAIGKVQVDPNNSNTVIVGTKTGLYFSYDAGSNWTGPCLTNSHTNQRQDITGLLVRDDGATTTLYAAVGTRGFPTTVQPDLGLTGANAVYSSTIPVSGCPASWSLLNNGWPAGTGDGDPTNDSVGRIDLAIAPSNPQVIYAQVASNLNGSATLGVWRTTNGGTSWTQQATPATFTAASCTSGIGQTWYNAGLTVDPNNSNVVFLSMIDLYKSSNGGTSFTNTTTGYCGGFVHVDQHARAFLGNSSSQLLIGNDGGMWYSSNATATNPTFITLNSTLPTIEFYGGDITANFAHSSTPGIVAGAQDNGSSVATWSGNPGPIQWQQRLGGDGVFARIEPRQALRWYMETQNGGMYVTSSGPYSSPSAVNGGWSADRRGFLFPYEIYKECTTTTCLHLIAGSYRVWETVTGGYTSGSWYVNSPDLTKGTLNDRSIINQLAFAYTDESIAIVGTNDGNVQIGFGLGTGVPNSATWVNVTGGNTVLPNRPILDVASSPANPLVAFAAVGGFDQNTPATPGHVFQVSCTANCASFTWENKSGNLPNIPVDSIIANPNFPQQVFAGTDWGLYYTNDINVASPVWYRFENGLPHVMIWDMSIDRGATTLAVFTRSRGAYVWPLPNGPVAPIYAVLAPSDSELDGGPNSSVVHDFVFYNLLQPDNYTVAVSGHSWPTTLLTSPTLNMTANSTSTVSIQVNIPNVINLSDSFTLTITSVSSPTLVYTATGSTNAVPHPAIVTSGNMNGTAYVGETITYTIAITNTGDYSDTFSIAIANNNWSTTPSSANVTLGVGQSSTVNVYVVVGSGSADTAQVTFSSSLNSSVTAVVLLNSTSLGSPGHTLYLPVVLRN